MRLITTAPLAVEVSLAGGLGFLGAGSDTDPENLERMLSHAKDLLRDASISTSNGTLPVGVGFINWGAPLEKLLPVLEKYKPTAVWLFAPRKMSDLAAWAASVRKCTASKIWIQIGSVQEALEACRHAEPDVLVVQGVDAGGHGLTRGAGIISLLPEVVDAVSAACKSAKMQKIPQFVAAGGIADGRGAAAALALGAEGVVMGTRYLASHEAVIAEGYKAEIIRATDGGQTTTRTHVYDTLRGTTDWPVQYGGRGVINASYEDAMNGMVNDENKRLYQEAIKQGDGGWGPNGRMTTYAGTNVGMVRKKEPAKAITEEVCQQCRSILHRISNDGM